MTDAKHQIVTGDQPITSPDEDLLGYAPFARHLAGSIHAMAPREGFVIGVYGPWGSGKTSMLRLVERALGELPEATRPRVLEFNPWWFAGQEDLTRHFIGQLRAIFQKWQVLRDDALEWLGGLADTLSDFEVPGAAALKKRTDKAIPSGQTVPELKDRIAQALRKSPHRTVVVMDDIDRLSADEIRQVFRLIKIVADFPNIIYVVAFDKEVAVRALEKAQGLNGESYLEKIIQVPVELPTPDRSALQRMLFHRLTAVLQETPDGLFDTSYWQNVYYQGIDHLITTPRHVVRLINALSFTYPAVRGEVNPVDFIAMEVLRLNQGALYGLIRDNPTMFTSPVYQGYGAPGQAEQAQVFHQAWLNQISESHRAGLRRFVLRLFPRVEAMLGGVHYAEDYNRRWRRELRVCSPDVFPVYFRLSLPEGAISSTEMRMVVAQAGDAPAFVASLWRFAQQLPTGVSRLSAFLEGLLDYTEQDIREADIPPIINAFLHAGDALTPVNQEPRGFLDEGDDVRMIRVMHRLLRRLDQPQRYTVLEAAIRHRAAIRLSTQYIAFLGNEHGRFGGRGEMPEQYRLVTSEQLTKLESLGLQKIRGAVAQGTLLNSPGLSGTLSIWREWAGNAEPRAWVEQVTQDDQGLLCLLEAFLTHITAQTIGDVATRIRSVLDPEFLAPYIDPAHMVARLERMPDLAALPERQARAVAAYQLGYQLRRRGIDPTSPLATREH